MKDLLKLAPPAMPPKKALPLSPLRLVMVSHYFPDHRGGIELVANALAQKLTLNGTARVKWFASDSDPSPPEKLFFTTHPMTSWNGLERRTGLPYPLWAPSSWIALWRAIQHCDLVHIHDYIYFGSLLAWAMSKLAHRPCVFTQHVGNVPLGNQFSDRMLQLINFTFGRFILRNSAAVVFVSDVVRNQFFRTNHHNVHVIANGVNSTVFHPLTVSERITLRAKLGFAEDRPILLFVGRFVTKKGLPLLKKLAPTFPKAQWVFAGRGPLDPGDWDQPKLRIYRDRTGTSLAELYQAADLLVLPSRGEGFPLVIQEAMSCGTPVLASNELSHALPELDQLLMTEKVEGDDALSCWQARLTGLLTAPNDLLARRHDTAKFAAKHWSWKRCVTSYLKLYREKTIP